LKPNSNPKFSVLNSALSAIVIVALVNLIFLTVPLFEVAIAPPLVVVGVKLISEIV